MSDLAVRNWLPQQQRRLASFGTPHCADVHCHCLPGLDDGPASFDEAAALCQALAEDGITAVVATPHQLGNYDRLNPASRIRQVIAALSAVLTERDIPLELVPGGDVRVDERLPRLLDSGEIGTLADAGRHLLLELPHELLVDPVPTIETLAERSLQAIISHPERYRYLQGAIDPPRDWVAAGAVLQITAGSLVGDFGSRAHDHAWRLLDAGLVSLVASDAHDAVRRPPQLTAALDLLTKQIGPAAARTICIDNPLRVLDGRTIDPPPLT